MLTFGVLRVAFLPSLASIVCSLPLADDTRITRLPIGNPEDAAPSAYPAVYVASDEPTRRADDHPTSSESSHAFRISSLSQALGLSSTATEAKAELKRDDMRNYDTLAAPRPWAFEDYRAVYLEGLARIAREGGNKKKGKRYPSEASLEFLVSKARRGKKQESMNKSGITSPTDGKEDIRSADNWGLTDEDYEAFFHQNLNDHWNQWTLEEWQDFQTRWLEFIAMGRQVGKGDRKRDEILEYQDGGYDDKSGITLQDWHVLRDWLRRNGGSKHYEQRPGSRFHKRDGAYRHDETMDDEDDDDSIFHDTLLDLNMWARLNGHLEKQKRSRDRWNAYQDSDTPIRRDSIYQYDDNMSDEDPMMTFEAYNSLYSSHPASKRVPGEAATESNGDRSGDSSISQKRDDIRNYMGDLTDAEWARLWFTSNADGIDRFVEEDDGGLKTKREASHQFESDIDFDRLSPEDIEDLHETAMTDPAFLEFQQQYLATRPNSDKVQKRLLTPTGIHQTAPVHKGQPVAETDGGPATGESSPSESASGERPSTGAATSEGDHLGLQQRRNEKRDDMYKYAGGLDDYDDYVLSSLFCDTAECESDLTQKRDSMDKYDIEPEDWKDYSELLNAMEEGRLGSFHSRINPRDETNFPPWGPPDNPAPPPVTSSRKEKRDTLSQTSKAFLSKRQYQGGGSVQDSPLSRWSIDGPPHDDPGRSELQKASLVDALDEDGHVTKEGGKRDKVDQYDRTMADEDEWIDIYRLYYVQRQRTRGQGSNVVGKRRSRRAPEPHPEPDTVVVQPPESGFTELPRPTTVSGGGVSSITTLLSFQGATPGPGATSTASRTFALSPNPSDIFFPFGPLLPLGPAQSSLAGARRRGVSSEASAAPEPKQEANQDTNAKDVRSALAIEERVPEPTLSMSSTITTAASSTLQIPPPSPTAITPPEIAIPSPSSPVNVSDIIQAFGPILDFASALPAISTTPQTPSAGSTNTSQPTKTKRDSISQYPPNRSIQNFSDEDWEALDNYITFQEANGPGGKKRGTPECLQANVDSSQNIISTEQDCLCREDTQAQPPSTTALDPCTVYTKTPPGAKQTRDHEDMYKVDADTESPLSRWVSTGRYRNLRRDMATRATAPQEQDQDIATSLRRRWQQRQQEERQASSSQNAAAASNEQTEEQEQEREQQQEGVEQAMNEQSGGGAGGKARRRRWQWVPEEEGLTEGLPEDAGHDRVKVKRERERRPPIMRTTESEGETGDEQVGRKRHCGTVEVPVGYGSNETAGLCG